MVARQPQAFQRRINSFVPAMAYAVDVIENGPSRFSLGTPAVGAPQAILAAQTITAATGTVALAVALLLSEMGGTYGRTLTVRKPSGSATGTVTVTGRDYLGQPMKETFTTVASTSTIVQGKKAFKYVDEVTWTAHAGSTLDLGTGNALGVPYVIENFHYAYENAVKMERNKDLVAVRVSINDTNTAATFTGRSPVKGSIVGTRAVVTTIIATADNNLTFNVNGGSAITNLALVLTFTSSAVGNTFQKSVAPLTANCAVVPGDIINVLTDGGGSAGAVEVEVLILPDAGVYTDPIYTDPQTATTGDPRGLYEPFNTLDGVIEIEVVYTANRDLNSSGRGGLHGIAHYFA